MPFLITTRLWRLRVEDALTWAALKAFNKPLRRRAQTRVDALIAALARAEAAGPYPEENRNRVSRAIGYSRRHSRNLQRSLNALAAGETRFGALNYLDIASFARTSLAQLRSELGLLSHRPLDIRTWARTQMDEIEGKVVAIPLPDVPCGTIIGRMLFEKESRARANAQVEELADLVRQAEEAGPYPQESFDSVCRTIGTAMSRACSLEDRLGMLDYCKEAGTHPSHGLDYEGVARCAAICISDLRNGLRGHCDLTSRTKLTA